MTAPDLASTTILTPTTAAEEGNAEERKAARLRQFCYSHRGHAVRFE